MTITAHPPGLLSVDASTEDGQAVVRLDGEIDMSTVGQLDEVLRRIEPDEPRTITFDMSGVTFMDSTALNRLARLYKHQRELHGDVAIRAPSRQTMRVLELSGLTKLLTIT